MARLPKQYGTMNRLRERILEDVQSSFISKLSTADLESLTMELERKHPRPVLHEPEQSPLDGGDQVPFFSFYLSWLGSGRLTRDFPDAA